LQHENITEAKYLKYEDQYEIKTSKHLNFSHWEL